MKFKRDDRVYLIKKLKMPDYWRPSKGTVYESQGTINSPTGEGDDPAWMVSVDWDNGHSNAHQLKDLELVKNAVVEGCKTIW